MKIDAPKRAGIVRFVTKCCGRKSELDRRRCGSAVKGHMGPAHRDIFLSAYLRVVVSPALPGIIQKAHPQQVKFGAVIYQNVRVPFSLWRNDREWRI